MKHNYVPDGCFLLARQIFDSAIWRDDPHVLKLFIYLIGSARHNKKPKKYSSFEIKRGELVTSLAKIAEENEYNQNGTIKTWARMKISRMLDLLEKQGYIKKLCDTYGTHISICNYDLYQDMNNYKCDTVDTQVGSSCDTSGKQVGINNKGNNEKKGNNKHTLPKDFSISEGVIKWAAEKGHTNLEEHLENFIIKSKAKKYKYVDWDSAFQGAIRDNWANLKDGKSDSTFNNLHTKDYGENEGDGTKF